MAIEIIPAIIGHDFNEVSSKIAQIDKLAIWAQLDIMDGVFVPEVSWQNAADLAALSGQVKLEAHLMVRDPEDLVEDWLHVCDRVIIHLESSEKIAQVLETINNSPAEAGLALLMETPLEQLAPFIAQVKTVQLMSIATIGHYGEPLDERVYERIKLLRAQYPSVKINIDGGVNLSNAIKLVAAGADRLVIGSALWQAPDLAATIQNFQKLI